MMEEQIKLGSVVCFKSAPNEKLTVVDLYSDGDIKVIYFNVKTYVFDSYRVHKSSLILSE